MTDTALPSSTLETAASKRIVTIVWTTDRKPKVAKPAAKQNNDPNWPTRGKVSKSLKPKTGPLRQTAPVMFITLFQVSPRQIDQAVQRILRKHKASHNFTPLFLTDSLYTAPIREAGYTFEVISPYVFSNLHQRAMFEERFMTLWRKWSGVALIDFSAAGFLAAHFEDLDLFIQIKKEIKNRFDPHRTLKTLPQPVTTDVVALRAEYRSAGLDQVDDTFVLYRIIGNDLPPRHEAGQTLRNMKFLLENEPPLQQCEKRWVVNRIVDPVQEAAIIALLKKHSQPYLLIPFSLTDYRLVEWDLESFPDDAFFLSGRYHNMLPHQQMRAQAHAHRFKNSYVINNNGARNAALRDGRDRAKWVLPWDGNCFLTATAWDEIVTNVTEHPYLKYFTVPMARLLNNAELLKPDFHPIAEEEPQILFRTDATEEFDELSYYGRRPKVQLFYQLAIPGKWDAWGTADVWERPRAPRSTDAGSTGTAGWVARLYSGQAEMEQDKVNSSSGLKARGDARNIAILDMLVQLDVTAAQLVYDPDKLTAYDMDQIKALAAAPSDTPEARYIARLTEDADLALQCGPFSVVDKTAVPPSGDPHDYYNPAPYWWPNPTTANGIPLIFRDGDRIPGTRLYELESEQYDRTRLQRLFDSTTTLALAWVATENDTYIQHAARQIRTWFLDEDTRMNPHLLFAQIRPSVTHNHGSKYGLIEMKDLYFFLDAVRLVEKAGALSETEKTNFRDWLGDYLDWLQNSEQGLAERLSPNNHGTCYDLQTASIAAFLGDIILLKQIFRISRERMLEQFTTDGQQPYEMKRTQTAHYCAFNMHCWINLANLAEACGDRLWMFETEDGRGLATVFDWLLPRLAQETWKYQQIEPFDRARFLQLFFAARNRALSMGGLRLADPLGTKPLFFPHDGIKPYWMINPPVLETGRSENWRRLARSLQKLEITAFKMDDVRSSDQNNINKDDLDVKVLDKKLWGGFSGPALTALEALRTDPSTPLSERNSSSRVLARWYSNLGDAARTLASTETMEDLGVMGDFERQLLRSNCFNQLGQADAASDSLKNVRRMFAKDANLHLITSNFAVPSADATAAAINRIFAETGLPDAVVAIENALAPAQSLQNSIEKEHRISVILTINESTDGLIDTITSVLSQTWSNLELLVSYVAQKGRTLCAEVLKFAEQDDRVIFLKYKADLPLYAARNAALKKATGSFVTVIEQGDIAHTMRLQLQIQPLLAGEAVATQVQHAILSANLRVIGSWAPDFAFVHDKASSVMLATQTLRDANGWDAVKCKPDAYLTWRIRKAFGKDALQTVLPRMPMTITSESLTETNNTHITFPFGQHRDDLRRLQRLTAKAEVGALAPNAEPALPAALPLKFISIKLDAVFVGDFSSGAVALEQITGLIAARATENEAIGIFHWSDYHDTWSASLDDTVAALIDEGKVAQISAYEDISASEVILCHSSILHHFIDGWPQFGNKIFVVISGPEISTSRQWQPQHTPHLLMSEIEEIFGQKVTLRNL